MNKLFSISFLMLLLILTSCNKKAIDYNPDFIGYWKSEITVNNFTGEDEQSYLILGVNKSECAVDCDPSCLGLTCDCLQATEGRALVNTSRSKIRIGPNGRTVTFTINTEPYLNSDSLWICELNGLQFYKQ